MVKTSGEEAVGPETELFRGIFYLPLAPSPQMDLLGPLVLSHPWGIKTLKETERAC